MAVNWDWKAKKGEIQWLGNGEPPKTYKVTFYQANCLGALTYNFKEDGQDMYRFMGFWNDLDHLKRCLGLAKNYDNTYENIYEGVIKKIKLNTYYKDSIKIAELFAKAGHKVELYYEDIDKKRGKK
jgi:hypothetical protein